MIKGIHHVSMKCSSDEEYTKTKDFYGNVLKMEIAREWPTGIMYDTGAGLIELSNSKEEQLPRGTIRHFALMTDDVEECVKAVKEAGYEVFMEPKDIEIKSDPPYPARIAFCYGPMGEEIEFFKEK